MQEKASHLVFILNPNAGTGIRNIESRIQSKCQELNVEAIICESNSIVDSIEIIDKHFDLSSGLFHVVGGDGTINSVSKVLLGKGGSMGIIPAGSGNGLARFLGIPINVEKAIEKSVNGKDHEIDVWRINNRLFVNVAGLGFDAEIARLFSDRKKKGLWGYASYVTSTVFGYKSSPYEIQVNNINFSGNYFLVAFFNGSQYGNNTVVAPEAMIDDGLVDLVGVPPMTTLSVLENVYRCMISHTGVKNALTQKADIITLKSPVKLPYHVDGEFCGFSDSYHLKKDSKKLKVRI